MTRRTPLPARLQRHPFSRSDALAAGVAIDRLRAKDLCSPFRGVHSTSSPQGVRGYCDAYAPRLRPGQFFSHTTAALLWEIPIESARVRTADLHVSAGPDARAPKARGVHGHTLTDVDVAVERRYGHPVTDVTTTWCQLAGRVSFDELVIAGDSIVRVPHFTDDDLALRPWRVEERERPFATIAELSARVSSYRGRGKHDLVRALPLVRVGADSPRETRLRLLLQRAGLPEPELNVEVWNPDGEWAGRVDLFYRQHRVVVEYDGDQHRTDVETYDNDQLRLERLINAGCTVVRVRMLGLGTAGAEALTVSRVREALGRGARGA